jgi:hypothetical protein
MATVILFSASAEGYQWRVVRNDKVLAQSTHSYYDEVQAFDAALEASRLVPGPSGDIVATFI